MDKVGMVKKEVQMQNWSEAELARQESGSVSDQGNSLSNCSSVGSFPSLGSSVRRYDRYPNTLSPLRFADSIML